MFEPTNHPLIKSQSFKSPSWAPSNYSQKKYAFRCLKKTRPAFWVMPRVSAMPIRDLENPSPQVKRLNWLWRKMTAAFWLSAACGLIWYTNFFRTLAARDSGAVVGMIPIDVSC